MHPLRLRRMAVLIKLVAEYGDDNDQAAKHEIKDVIATHMSLLARGRGAMAVGKASARVLGSY
jgi:hypothetical protein